MPSVLFPISRSGSSGFRLFESQMVGPLKLRLRAIRYDQPGLSESGDGEGVTDFSDPFVVKPVLVPTSAADGTPASVSVTTEGRSIDRSGGKPAPSVEPTVFPTPSMADCANIWRAKGVPEKVIPTVLASWAENSVKQYDSVLRAWAEYVSSDTVESSGDITFTLLAYLQAMFDAGKNVNTINVHKSAICTILSELFEIQWNSALLARFQKGLFRLRPTKSKYSAFWDVAMVLDALESWGPNDALTCDKMVRKLAVILALCSPRRVSELAALSLEHCSQSSERWIFYLEFRNKNRKSGPAHKADFAAFPQRQGICPVICILDFLKKVKNLRKDDRLLVSPKTGKGVTATTVARWIKETLTWCGVENSFGAHSTRGAATSTAFAVGVPVGKIMEAAHWSKRSQTFQKHYHRDTAGHSFQEAVLGSKL